MRLLRGLGWVCSAAILAPAVLLTVVRLFEPQSPLAVRLVAFTPWAIPACALIVTVLLLRLAWPRSRRRGVTGVGLVVIAGLLGVHLWWFSPQLIGAERGAPTAAPELTVMSANLLAGEADAVEVLATAVRKEVDVLVLVEIPHGTLAQLRAAGLDEAFAHQVGTAGGSIEGTIIASSLPLEDTEPIDTAYGGWAATADLAGTGVRVAGVHPRPPVGDTLGWRADHEALLSFARDQVAGDLPVLVAGDFNATPDHRPMRALARAGLRTSAEVGNEGWLPTWPTRRTGGLGGVLTFPGVPLVQIDHVLIDHRLAPRGTRTTPIPGSDHRAVLATVAVR